MASIERDPLKLALVLAGDKPGTIVRSGPWTDLAAFADRLSLYHTQIAPSSTLYVSDSQELIEQLPSVVRNEPAYHRQLGEFFGYPSAAIEHFVADSRTARLSPAECVRSGVFTPAEMAHTAFVSYTPVETTEGFARAIEDGRTHRRRLQTLAHRWELPALQSLAKEVYQSAIDRYRDDQRVAESVV